MQFHVRYDKGRRVDGRAGRDHESSLGINDDYNLDANDNYNLFHRKLPDNVNEKKYEPVP